MAREGERRGTLTACAAFWTPIISSRLRRADRWRIRELAGPKQIFAYRRFQHSLLGFGKLTILPFDEMAAERFVDLQRRRLRVGTMDLKIASICLAHDATLLTRNLRDFELVPGLRVENWLD